MNKKDSFKNLKDVYLDVGQNIFGDQWQGCNWSYQFAIGHPSWGLRSIEPKDLFTDPQSLLDMIVESPCKYDNTPPPAEVWESWKKNLKKYKFHKSLKGFDICLEEAMRISYIEKGLIEELAKGSLDVQIQYDKSGEQEKIPKERWQTSNKKRMSHPDITKLEDVELSTLYYNLFLGRAKFFPHYHNEESYVEEKREETRAFADRNGFIGSLICKAEEAESFMNTLFPSKKILLGAEEKNDFAQKPLEQESRAVYSTTYLDIMQEAIRELGISNENQPKVKETLIPHFEKKLQERGEHHPKNKAKMMSTFVRLPESTTGGNKTIPKK